MNSGSGLGGEKYVTHVYSDSTIPSVIKHFVTVARKNFVDEVENLSRTRRIADSHLPPLVEFMEKMFSGFC